MSSLSIGGQALTLAKNVAQGTDAAACGVAYRVSPATGSQTLAWAWSGSGAVEEGGQLVIAFVKGINTASPVADSQATADEAAGPTTESVTLSTPAGTEFCVGVVSSYDPTTPNGAPASSDQVVDLNDSLHNNYMQDLFHETTTDTPTTVMNGTGSYASLAAIAFNVAGGGGGAATRGAPFGHRGTAFNGGKTLQGILQ